MISMESRHNLNQFQSTHGKCQIVLIAETNLSSIRRVTFKNYTFIRTDKPTALFVREHGIFVREHLEHKSFNTEAWKLVKL